MRRWSLFAAALVALGAFAAPVDAQALHPVFVTIEGHGAIRFRLSGLFDGRLEPGTYSFLTPASAVCYSFTSGAFREINWSTEQCAPTVVDARFKPRPVHIIVRTD